MHSLRHMKADSARRNSRCPSSIYWTLGLTTFVSAQAPMANRIQSHVVSGGVYGNQQVILSRDTI